MRFSYVCRSSGRKNCRGCTTSWYLMITRKISLTSGYFTKYQSKVGILSLKVKKSNNFQTKMDLTVFELLLSSFGRYSNFRKKHTSNNPSGKHSIFLISFCSETFVLSILSLSVHRKRFLRECYACSTSIRSVTLPIASY